MNNAYIENGYVICKALGDAMNGKVNSVEKCRDKEDVECRLKFLKAHNLLTFYDFVIDKNDVEFYLGKDKSKLFSDKVKKAVFKQMKLEMKSDTISARLRESSVKHLILKGITLKRFYPKNIVRTSTDIDIYVDESDLSVADEVLKNLGFTFEGRYNECDYNYIKEPRYKVEVHSSMDGYTKEQKHTLKQLADKTLENNCDVCSLSDDDTYIYIVFHLYKHFVQSGAGVRMLLDIHLMRKNANLDFSYISPILCELGIDGFEEVMSKICRVLFENEEADDELKDVVEFIFDSGAFGKVSNYRHLSKINLTQTYRSKTKQMSLAYGLSFKAMKERYPVLKKAPVLYPFSFIHRFIYGVFHRRDVLKKEYIQQKSISKSRIKDYEKIFITTKIEKDNTKK